MKRTKSQYKDHRITHFTKITRSNGRPLRLINNHALSEELQHEDRGVGAQGKRVFFRYLECSEDDTNDWIVSRRLAGEDKNDNIELAVSWARKGADYEKIHRMSMATYLKNGVRQLKEDYREVEFDVCDEANAAEV
ncbi:hypothetical protein EG328_010835 [Venturia inaequalis]|uniref:Uncharacterized protein n=1 Tax=Venturia inaequalis TaxID=5025 RepID=A0A8H3U6N8_VENIN|nr:hypothetical protein EG328_010835 [Venturia inaequalis]